MSWDARDESDLDPVVVRRCECGREFTPQFTNTVRCPACIHRYTAAEPVRAHLARLRASKSLCQVGREAGVRPATVRSIGSKLDRQFVSADIAERLLAVDCGVA
ncbi:hypothetical protein ACFXHA_45090 [Nocardia sp. NPDC059240]|uniref:hypothetical protein n=1 Tax=Nocardia sp. NPDC059240 TaxID=3346786 RepID=UPI0036B5CD42